MKTFISLSSAALFALGLSACASGTGGATSTAALTADHCKAHLAQFVPSQNKNDAALRKDAACADVVKKQ